MLSIKSKDLSSGTTKIYYIPSSTTRLLRFFDTRCSSPLSVLEHYRICQTIECDVTDPKGAEPDWKSLRCCYLCEDCKATRTEVALQDLESGLQFYPPAFKSAIRQSVPINQAIQSYPALRQVRSINAGFLSMLRWYSYAGRSRREDLNVLEQWMFWINFIAAELIHLAQGPYNLPAVEPLPSCSRPNRGETDSDVPLQTRSISLRRSLSTESLLEPLRLSSAPELQQLLGDLDASQAFVGIIATGHSRQLNGTIFNIDVHINHLTIRRRHSEESFVTARTALSTEAATNRH